MDKAVGAYRTISEVGEELDIPQHVLRFWETRFAQIKPMKRSGGRRYYRPADVLLLKGIRQLLYGEGYTIKGVQRILATKGPASCSAREAPRERNSPASRKLNLRAGSPRPRRARRHSPPNLSRNTPRRVPKLSLKP